MCLPQHWLVQNERRKTAEFFNNMFSLSLYPFIFKLSRITSESATLADVNLTDKSIKSGWLVTDINDHLLVFAVFDSGELKPRIQEIYSFSNSFIDKNKLLNVQQYGFRSNRWTCLAVMDFVENISSAKDEKQHGGFL